MKLVTNFDLWLESAIKLTEKIIIAPEDLIIGTIGFPEKREFSYKRAKRLEKKFLIPNGWRLPTAHEFDRIIEAIMADESLFKKLRLNEVSTYDFDWEGNYTTASTYWSADPPQAGSHRTVGCLHVAGPQDLPYVGYKNDYVIKTGFQFTDGTARIRGIRII